MPDFIFIEFGFVFRWISNLVESWTIVLHHVAYAVAQVFADERTLARIKSCWLSGEARTRGEQGRGYT